MKKYVSMDWIKCFHQDTKTLSWHKHEQTNVTQQTNWSRVQGDPKRPEGRIQCAVHYLLACPPCILINLQNRSRRPLRRALMGLSLACFLLARCFQAVDSCSSSDSGPVVMEATYRCSASGESIYMLHIYSYAWWRLELKFETRIYDLASSERSWPGWGELHGCCTRRCASASGATQRNWLVFRHGATLPHPLISPSTRQPAHERHCALHTSLVSISGSRSTHGVLRLGGWPSCNSPRSVIMHMHACSEKIGVN